MRSDSGLEGSMPFETSSDTDNFHPLNGSSSVIVSGERGSGVSEDASDRSSLINNLDHPMIVYAPETRIILQDQTDEAGIQGSQYHLDSSSLREAAGTSLGQRQSAQRSAASLANIPGDGADFTQDNVVNGNYWHDEHNGLSLDVDNMSYEEVINANEMGAALDDCFHEFHLDCITNSLLVKNVCPICRTIAVN